jgi:transcriptional regulator with XRE-family HTH domain
MTLTMGSMTAASHLLGRYLKSTGTTQAAFAQLVNVSEAAVHHWLSGYARPRHRVRMAIQEITGIGASGWDQASDAGDLEEFISDCEKRERLRRQQHQARMCAWRAILERRRKLPHVDAKPRPAPEGE